MSIDCETFAKWASTFSLVHSCERLPGGELRIATPFLYPDGSRIDVFYIPKREFFDSEFLSDLGQTSSYLADLHIFPHEHTRRASVLQRTCEIFGITNFDGEMRLELLGCDPISELSDRGVADGIFRLAHTCARIADLSFTKKFKLPSGFNSQVGSYLSVATNVRYEVNVRVLGKYDKTVPVDFRTAYKNKENLILTLSPLTITGAHSASGEVFRKWHLLEPRGNQYGFITLLDVASVSLRDDDLQLLREKSHVLGYPAQRDELREILGESSADIHG